MGKIIIICLFIIIVLVVVLVSLYAIMIIKLRRMNRKIVKYNEERNLKENNVLIVYQPSKHGTIEKIVECIKETLTLKGIGYLSHTLTKEMEDYSKYKKVIFVAPVYFGEIHFEFLKKIVTYNDNNLIIIYNGLNKESHKEDEMIKKYFKKYKKIKLYTEDIERVKPFINREVL